MVDNLQSIKQRFGIIGRSPLLDRALSNAVRVANTDLTVLITGESGVGKEVFSKIIHSLSARKHNKFIAINTGAIPEGTINSELFGHERGAFTGATNERKGYFETYDGGTIFLDEIGEMPLDTQAYLLRVLESGEYIRVGSSKILKTDVRIIAATNVKLEEKIREGKFREDLYFRLNTIPIKVPALRERREDIFLLFRKFAVDFAEKYRATIVQLDDQAVDLLRNYQWPGNIRELKNVAEQLSVLAENNFVTAEDLITLIPNISSRNLPVIPPSQLPGGQANSMQERDILYKLLFEMKSDLSHLKKLVYELISTNNLSVPDTTYIQSLSSPETRTDQVAAPDFNPITEQETHFVTESLPVEPDYPEESGAVKPIILNDQLKQMYQEVEDNLSLEENEKDLIKRALKKHNGKRKEAANDLGISERTLYRKIKQYNL